MSVDVQSRPSYPESQSGTEGALLSTGRIELRRISSSEWRISDTTIPAADAGSVLGFIEQTGDMHYEVLRLGHGHGIDRLSFCSLDEVVTYFECRR